MPRMRCHASTEALENTHKMLLVYSVKLLHRHRYACSGDTPPTPDAPLDRRADAAAPRSAGLAINEAKRALDMVWGQVLGACGGNIEIPPASTLQSPPAFFASLQLLMC